MITVLGTHASLTSSQVSDDLVPLFHQTFGQVADISRPGEASDLATKLNLVFLGLIQQAQLKGSQGIEANAAKLERQAGEPGESESKVKPMLIVGVPIHL